MFVFPGCPICFALSTVFLPVFKAYLFIYLFIYLFNDQNGPPIESVAVKQG